MGGGRKVKLVPKVGHEACYHHGWEGGDLVIIAVTVIDRITDTFMFPHETSN